MSEIDEITRSEIEKAFGFDASTLIGENWPAVSRNIWTQKMVGWSANKVHAQLDKINALVSSVNEDKAALDLGNDTPFTSELRVAFADLKQAIEVDHQQALQTFSIVINWNDNDTEEGTYGATVRARNYQDAEAYVRLEMIGEDFFAEDREAEEPEFGSVVDGSTGASWMAGDFERSLRDIIASGDISEINAIAKMALKPLEKLPVAHEAIETYLAEKTAATYFKAAAPSM